jgi:hypothetical protein
MGGVATSRVTFSGAECQASLAQAEPVAGAGGRDDGVACVGAAGCVGSDEPVLGAGAGVRVGVLVAHDATAASTATRMAAWASADGWPMLRIMISWDVR